MLSLRKIMNLRNCPQSCSKGRIIVSLLNVVMPYSRTRLLTFDCLFIYKTEYMANGNNRVCRKRQWEFGATDVDDFSRLSM